MQPESALPVSPVSWFAALVGYSEHCHCIALNLVIDRVWEVTKNMSPDPILVLGPHQGIGNKSIDYLKRMVRKPSAARGLLEVPEKCLADFCLCLGQCIDYKASQRALSLALASAQETALTVPARRAACRALISCRHASVSEESSLPSRLSSNAAVRAERSPAGNPRASSRMWSTWAFARRSLALKLIYASQYPDFESTRYLKVLPLRTFLRVESACNRVFQDQTSTAGPAGFRVAAAHEWRWT